MSDQLIGYDDDQHARLSKVVFAVETTTGEEIGVPRKKRGRSAPFARVMVVDDEYPIYDPREYREVALFAMSPDSNQTTLQMFGVDLIGDIQITIDGATYTVNCQASNDELREALGLEPEVCRVTVFPGTWEFAWVDDALPIEAIPYTDFYGGLLVTDELWRSISEDGVDPLLVDSVDAIPFLQGSVKRGALSLASSFGGSLYMAQHWHCPGFNFGVRVAGPRVE